MPSVKAHKDNLQRLTDTICGRVQGAGNRRDSVGSAGCVSPSQGKEVFTGEASYGVMSGETLWTLQAFLVGSLASC